MENQNKPTDNSSADSDSLESLEAQTTVVDSSTASDSTTDATSKKPVDNSAESGVSKKKRGGPIKGILGRINIYLLLFIFLLVIAGVVTALSFLKNQQANNTQAQIQTEPLSKEALDQLRQTDVKVGDPKQVLSVESNAVFAGKVLIRDSLEVAGEIKAGGPLNLPGITVTGDSILNQVQANSLQLNGNANIQGQMNIQNNLSVGGSGSFGGTLTAARLNIQDLQVSGDLQFSKHIDAGGGTPGKSDGAALGGGGTTSISGTDTAGTVAINTGGSPSAGCFVTVNFSQRFNGTPHVVITPVGSAAGALSYYINRASTSFSICSANTPTGGASFAFDYIVID